MHPVSVGAASLACTSTGHGGAPALLLHAGVTDQRSWGPLRSAVNARHRLVAYDRRGFGATTYVAEPHSAVDDALAVLDAAGIERGTLIGASNGGKRAIDLALAHPERVGALVLIGSGVRGAPEQDPADFSPEVQALWAAYEAAEAGDDLDHLNRIEAHAWLDGWVAPEGRVTGPVRDLFLDMNGVALRSEDPGDEHPLPSAWDRLGEIAVRTLVLCGDLDVVSLPTCQHLAAEIPGARFEVLLGTAHLPHLEGHVRTLELIGDFLDSVA